jgi:hypothetical protein
MPLAEWVEHPVAAELIHNGQALQAGLGRGRGPGAGVAVGRGAAQALKR